MPFARYNYLHLLSCLGISVALTFHPPPYLLLVLTTLFWSGNFVLGRAVSGNIPPIALSFWRWAVAFLILLLLTLPQLKGQWPLLRRHWKILILLGILGVTNYNTFAYIGLQYTTATNAVLMVSTTPVFIVALSFLLLGHTVHLRQALGIIASLLGVAIIVARGDLGTLLEQEINRGDAWIMAAVLSWALYSVCLKWRPAGLHPLSFLTAIMGTGLMVLVPIYGWDLARGNLFELNLMTLGSIGYVALFPSVLAYIFWNQAVAELGANKCGQFMHLMPAFGAGLSWLLLGEGLHGFHMAGIGLIALGIYLATVRR